MSIPHIEELPPRKTLEILANFWDYEATEKLDGSQLLFGIDEDGFYTSRETKGGLRIYNVDDYELSFRNTYIRSAHIALESVLPILKDAGLTVGCQVEVEVLYGEFPNVVQYSPDRSFIIFLRATEGNVDIDHIRVKLADQSLTIPLIAPFTLDGKNIDYHEVSNVWEFARSPIIKIAEEVEKKRVDVLQHLEEYLYQPYNEHCSHIEFMETPLNKRMTWADPKNNWRNQQKVLGDTKFFMTMQMKAIVRKFKDELLIETRMRHSQFGPTTGWIEGLVFRHRETGQMFKVVDKEIFLTVKDFLWAERNKLFKLKSFNEEDLDNRLDKYEKEKDKLSLEIPRSGKPIYAQYKGAVDARTKEIFATLYQRKETVE